MAIAFIVVLLSAMLGILAIIAILISTSKSVTKIREYQLDLFDEVWKV